MERNTQGGLMRVYISGAITKDKGYYQKFLNAEHKLKANGFEVINPARIGRLLPKSFSHGEFMDIDIELIKKCDAVYMLKGWNTNIGAKNEYSIAKERGLKIVYEVGKNDKIEIE